MSERVMIITGVPSEAADDVLNAIAGAGGGIAGEYTHCAFTHLGFGQFKPADDADPHVGKIGQVNRVAEVRIETFCERNVAKQVVQAIKQAHPYEEVVVYVLPLLSEDDL